MKYQVVVSSLAEIEILESANFYEEQKEGLGIEFLDELENAKTKLSIHPHNYSYISKNKTFRSLSLNRFPFKLIYEIHNNRIIITSVYHNKRKPLQ